MNAGKRSSKQKSENKELIIMRQLRHHNLAPTPSVIINVKRFSLTFKKLSASVSVHRKFLIAVVRATATPSHSSSTSCKDRNEPVVFST